MKKKEIIANIAGLALHVFTCYIAYKTSFLATLLTFFLPFASQVYWFFAVWSATGQLFNLYTVACFVVIGLYVVGYGGMMLADDSKPASQEPLYTDEEMKEWEKES